MQPVGPVEEQVRGLLHPSPSHRGGGIHIGLWAIVPLAFSPPRTSPSPSSPSSSHENVSGYAAAEEEEHKKERGKFPLCTLWLAVALHPLLSSLLLLLFTSCFDDALLCFVAVSSLFVLDSWTYSRIFVPGGSLAHSHRGDLGGVAGFLPPKPVEEVTRNMAMLGTSNLQFAAYSPISDLDTLLANSTWQP